MDARRGIRSLAKLVSGTKFTDKLSAAIEPVTIIKLLTNVCHSYKVDIKRSHKLDVSFTVNITHLYVITIPSPPLCHISVVNGFNGLDIVTDETNSKILNSS